MLLRGVVLASVLFLAASNAAARSGGITGHSGKSGTYCYNCHGGPDANARATILINGMANNPGPFLHTQTYPVDVKFCTNSAFNTGFNIAVGGPANGGKLTLPVGSNGVMDQGEVRHGLRVAGVTMPPPFSAGCTHEATVRVNWQPPALPSNTPTPGIRMYAAGNWGPQGAGRTTVLTTTLTPTVCSPAAPADCGRPIPVQPSACADADGDGYVASTCWADATNGGGDCNDNSVTIHPLVQDTCNNVDDDCDGQTDEDATRTPFLRDMDLDTWGGAADAGRYCSAAYAPAGAVNRGGDCNDAVGAINPGAAEVCDGVDNNCGAGADENFTVISRGVMRTLGQPCDSLDDLDECELGTVVCTSLSAAGCAGDSERTETCNTLDDDCDGQVDENWSIFQAGNRLTPGMRCDANTDQDFCPNGTVTCASASSVACTGDVATPELCDTNNTDNDCDTLMDRDDGFAQLGQSCAGGGGCGTGRFVCTADGTALRCDEMQLPAEICGNGVDDNCDGATDELSGTWMGLPAGATCDRPDDGDGCATGTVSCLGGLLGCGGETDRVELCANGLDDNCDGATDESCPDAGAPDAAGPPDAAVLTSSSAALPSSTTTSLAPGSSSAAGDGGPVDAGGRDAGVSDASRTDAGDTQEPDAGDQPPDGNPLACVCAAADEKTVSPWLLVLGAVVLRRRR